MDLADFDTVVASDNGFELELRNPMSNVKLGVYITVMGRDSSNWQELLKSRRDEQRTREAAAAARGQTLEPNTADQDEDASIDMLVSNTKGWRNVSYKGEELPFNVPNARKLYKEQLWIRRQVDSAIANLGNFTEGSN